MTIQEIFVEYRASVQHIASLLLALAMWRWGGAPERWLSAIFVGLFTVPNLLAMPFSNAAFFFLEGGVFYAAIDIIAATCFTIIAVNANRNYTLWIAAFQLVPAAAHGVRFVTDTVSPMAHVVMVIGPSYFQLLLMLVGLIRHVRRTKRYGEYRDWRIPRREIDFAALSRGQG